MTATLISVEDEQLLALRELADARRQSVDVLVRAAIRAYLDDQAAAQDRWQQEFQQILDEIRAQVPPSITPEEIEADITAAREEVRQVHRASRGR